MSDNSYLSPNITPAQQEEEQVIRLADIWAMVWNHKWWYVFSLAACLFLAMFYLYRTPKTYSRREQIILDVDNQNAMMRELTSVTSSSAARRYYSSGNSVDNEMQALASPDLMELVVARLGLETSYTEKRFLRTREMYLSSPVDLQVLEKGKISSFAFDVVKTGENSFNLEKFRTSSQPDPITISGKLGDTLQTPAGVIRIVPGIGIDRWKRKVSVSWVNPYSRGKSYCGRLSVTLVTKMSSVIQLALTDLFPSRADLVLTTLLDVYNEVWMENHDKSLRATSKFLEERIEVIESDLGGIENALKNYKQTHQISDISQAGSAISQQSLTYNNRVFEVSNQLSIARMLRDFANDPMHAQDLLPANTGLESANIASQINEYNSTLLQRDRALS